jgi:pteridine reductase
VQALVTGGSGLIGSAVVRALGGAGYTVRVHHHRGEDRARALAGEISDRGGRADTIGADLRDAASAALLTEGLDRLDLLVHAVGGYARASLSDTTPALLQDLLALNLAAPLWAIRAAAPLLRAARGQAIVLLDIAAEQPWRDHAAYAASRAAMAHALRCLALELAPDVRCNGVAPGLVRGATAVEDETFTRLQGRIPGGRAATPAEVADTVLLLARAPVTITGQVLAVDGGRALGTRVP